MIELDGKVVDSLHKVTITFGLNALTGSPSARASTQGRKSLQHRYTNGRVILLI